MRSLGAQGEGLGSCRFANGNSYEGSFHDGTLSGLGVYVFTAGGSYAGQARCLASSGLSVCMHTRTAPAGWLAPQCCLPPAAAA